VSSTSQRLNQFKKDVSMRVSLTRLVGRDPMTPLPMFAGGGDRTFCCAGIPPNPTLCGSDGCLDATVLGIVPTPGEFPTGGGAIPSPHRVSRWWKSPPFIHSFNRCSSDLQKNRIGVPLIWTASLSKFSIGNLDSAHALRYDLDDEMNQERKYFT
jgi:hypothetical protein